MAISKSTRWIATATGCLTAVTGIPFLSWYSSVPPSFLVVGAALGVRYPRLARDLMWFGAGVTTVWVLPVMLGILRISLKGGTDPMLIVAAIGSILLVVTCDGVLIKEAFSRRLSTVDRRLMTND